MKGKLHPSKTDPNWLEKHSARVKKAWDENPDRKLKASNQIKQRWADNYDSLRSAAIINAKKASIASSKLRKGKKFPGTGLSGKENPIAIHWTVIDPDGVVTECYGDLNKYAESHNLKYDTLKKFGVKNQNTTGHKGYRVFKNGRIKDMKD